MQRSLRAAPSCRWVDNTESPVRLRKAPGGGAGAATVPGLDPPLATNELAWLADPFTIVTDVPDHRLELVFRAMTTISCVPNMWWRIWCRAFVCAE
jgi:hypothetical protein